MKILIDNGHGVNTLGKCSPDKRLREYAYCREIAQRIVDRLKKLGYDAERLVTEETDVSLGERCRRANAHCAKLGTKNVLLISVHNNAAGSDGNWHTASGFCPFVYTKASARSKRLAQLLYAEAAARNLTGNRSVPASHYWEANFYIVKNSNCPAVLTENMFQDCKSDVDLLLSEAGKTAITDLHVQAIIKYINSEK